MGKGRASDGCCKVRSDVWKLQEFWGAIALMVCSLIWFVLCLDGLNKVPKCRYGEPECYFTREITDYLGTSTGRQFFNRKIEGDSSHLWSSWRSRF